MNTGSQLSAIQRALLQEAYLAQSLLCGGMTAIRRLSFNDQGRAYEGFFGLANGMERTAKLILVSDQYLRTGTFPDDRELKKFGHNLIDFFKRVEGLDTEIEVRSSESPAHDGGSRAVVAFLDNFAQQGRYFNLKRLSQGDGHVIEDPLNRWVELVDLHALNTRTARPSSRDAQNDAVARNLDDLPTMVVDFHALGGGPIASFQAAAAQERHDQRTSLEGMLLTLRPVRFLTRAIWRFTGSREPLPFYSEIFTEWLAPDSVLRRRRGFPRGRR